MFLRKSFCCVAALGFLSFALQMDDSSAHGGCDNYCRNKTQVYYCQIPAVCYQFDDNVCIFCPGTTVSLCGTDGTGYTSSCGNKAGNTTMRYPYGAYCTPDCDCTGILMVEGTMTGTAGTGVEVGRPTCGGG